MAPVVKSLSTNAGDIRVVGLFQGQEDSLEEGRASHFSFLAWRILWTEESGRLQSIGSERVRRDLTCMHTQQNGILALSR